MLQQLILIKDKLARLVNRHNQYNQLHKIHKFNNHNSEMKENPENKNSGFFLQKISCIIFESEERFQLIFDKPKEVSE